MSFVDEFLSRPDNWFEVDSKWDEYLTNKYSGLLDQTMLKIKTEVNIPIDIHIENKKYIDDIIILDQLSRHIKRIFPEKYDWEQIDKYANILSLSIASFLTEVNTSHEKRVFSLLPIRHSKDINAIQDIVIPMILEFRKKWNIGIYKRFYKATLIQLANLIKPELMGECSDIINVEYLDSNSSEIKNTISPYDNSFHKEFIEVSNNFDLVIISISGGVDSMVSLFIAKHVLKCDIAAVHINYGNRESSNFEESLCVYWANLLNIPIYVRRITEIKRNSEDRTIYEEVTKVSRFNSYKYVGTDRHFGVILGHNEDDALENIFQNISKFQHFDNLRGMKKIGETCGVPILRPFLEIKKSEILKFAKKHDIPYAYDSTPSWSKRGQMRDKLIPSIKDFDANILKNLIGLSKTYEQLYEFVNENIENNINFVSDKICEVSIKNEIPDFLWKKIIFKIVMKFNISMISMRSIQNFIKQIDVLINKKISLSDKLIAIRKDDVILFTEP